MSGEKKTHELVSLFGGKTIMTRCNVGLLLIDETYWVVQRGWGRARTVLIAKGAPATCRRCSPNKGV